MLRAGWNREVGSLRMLLLLGCVWVCGEGLMTLLLILQRDLLVWPGCPSIDGCGVWRKF